jgi:large subunit ribosomal protein L10
LAISKERKEELVAQYTKLLEECQALIVTDYRGLTNSEMIQLRRKVRQANGAYHVTKVTLLKRAMEAVGLPFPEEAVEGPVALGFCFDDVPGVAKVLVETAEETDFLTVRGGVLGDRLLSAKEVQSLAKLPPLEVLFAQILGLLNTPAATLVGSVSAGTSQVVNVLHAYTQQGEQQA